MSRKDAILLKSFFIFLAIVIVGLVATVYIQRTTKQVAKATPTSTVSQELPLAPKEPLVTESEVKSPKGDKKLTLVATTGANGTTMYEFSIDGRPLFAKTLGPISSMSLPFNAWDPTDTYVFVEQRDNGKPTYLVMRTDGELFSSGDKFIDVGAVWTTKEMGYTIREATGWASGTLLIIYTSTDDGSKGPAFWFEIPSTAIIQLSG